MTEIENYRNNSQDIKIPLFDKESSDFCFEKSREILSKPFSIDLNTSTLDKRYFDKKTRDLIGENLLDIEKTLNALNLDFLQAFNELEKTDSAETLFGDNFLMENKLKAPQKQNLPSFDNKSKEYYKPIEKPENKTPDKPITTNSTPNPFSPQESTITSRNFFFNYSQTTITERSHEASTNRMFPSPSPGKRHGLNMSNSSIQTSHYMSSTPNQSRKFDEAFVGDYSAEGPRQRSMSFTENFELRSPLCFKNPAMKLLQKAHEASPKLTASKPSTIEDELAFILPSQSQLIANKPRNIITYKPKTVRARNLRRLSYNPINMTNTSSSSSESELDRSMAHSECDIRTKMYTSRVHRRRYQQQYLNNQRKLNTSTTSGYCDRNGRIVKINGSQYNSNNSSNSRDKLYGSNASIKSAPQYYLGDRKKPILQEDVQQIPLSSDDIDSDEDFDSSIADRRIIKPTPQIMEPTLAPQTPTSNLNNIYEFVGKCFSRTRGNTTDSQQQQQIQKYLSGKHNFNYASVKGNKISSSNLDLLYTEFDITKLTGKSPTTQSYFDILNYSNTLNSKKEALIEQKQLEQQQKKLEESKTPSSAGSGTFQWPEKIHGSTVMQNDLIWQLQQQHEQDLLEKQERQKSSLLETLKMKKSAYSTGSSSTETDSLDFHHDFIPNRMPPSPAP